MVCVHLPLQKTVSRKRVHREQVDVFYSYSLVYRGDDDVIIWWGGGWRWWRSAICGVCVCTRLQWFGRIGGGSVRGSSPKLASSLASVGITQVINVQRARDKPALNPVLVCGWWQWWRCRIKHLHHRCILNVFWKTGNWWSSKIDGRGNYIPQMIL